MAKSWAEVEQSQQYRSAAREDQIRAKQLYFDDVVRNKPGFSDLSVEDQTRAHNLFFGIQNQDLDTIGSQSTYSEDISDRIQIMTPEEEATMRAKGPIGVAEAFHRQNKADLIAFSPTPVMRTGKLYAAMRRQKANEYDSDFDRQKDRDLIANFFKKEQESQIRGYTFGAQVYRGVSMIPGFMVEFALTGGLAAFGKKIILKGAGASAKTFTMRAAGAIAGGAVRGLPMYNRYAPKMMERQIFANLALTDTGQAIFQESTETPYTSFMKAYTSVVIENVSEVSGGVITRGLGKVGTKLGKVFPKKLTVAMLKAYRKIRPTGKMAEFITKTGYHGVLEEMGEEQLGRIASAITGVEEQPGVDTPLLDRLIDSVPDGQQLLVEAGVFSVPGAMSVATQQAYNLLTKQGKVVDANDLDQTLSQSEKEAVVEANEQRVSRFTEQEIDKAIEREDALEQMKESDEIDNQQLEKIVAEERSFDQKVSGEELLDKDAQKEVATQVKAEVNQLDKIEQKIASLEKEGEKVPESLKRRRDEAFKVLEELGLPKEIKRKQGVSAAKLLGQYTKNITVSEAKALKTVLRRQEQVSKVAAREARKQERARLTTLFRQKSQDAASVKNQLVKYVKGTIPLRDSLGKEINARGKMLSLVEKTKTTQGLKRAFEKIDKEYGRIQRENVIKEIKRDTKRALKTSRMSVDYQEKVQDLLDIVDLSKASNKRIQQLRKTKAFIEKSMQEGKKLRLPLSLFNRLERLFKIPLADMPLSSLELLKQDIEDLVSLGKLKLATREKINILTKERILRKMEEQGVQDATTIEKEIPELGKDLQISDKIRNAWRKKIDQRRHLGEAITGMDYLFDWLDQLKDYSGVLYTNFKKRIDIDHDAYLNQRNKLSDEIISYVQKHDMTDEQFIRVGVYAVAQQEGGLSKLKNVGVSQKQVEAIEDSLTDVEKGMYDLMRKRLDELAPQIKEMLEKVYNKPFQKVKNYFSYLTDYDAMSKAELSGKYTEMDLLLDMVTGNAEEFGQKQKNPDLRFTEKRSRETKQRIKVNALQVYLRHIDHAVYAINMSESLKLLNDVARSDRFQEMLGDRGTQYVTDWLRTVARNGVSGDFRPLDIMRENLSAAQFGFKIFTTVLQSTAIMDGAAKIGNWAFKGMRDIVHADVRAFVLQNFPEIKERHGGELDIREFGAESSQSKFKKAGFYAMRRLDGLTAASVGFGAYRQYLAKEGIPLDLTKPNQDAITYAQRMVRLTQASANAKDLPPALMSKAITGSVSMNRALFQFQTFLLNRWQLIRHEMVRYGIGKKEFGRGVNVLFWLMMANFAEYGLREVSRNMVNVVTGNDDDDAYEEDSVAYGMMMTALGNIPFVSMGVSLFGYGSNPIPVFDIMADMVDAVKKVQRSTKERTKAKWIVQGASDLLAITKGFPRTVGKWAVKFIEGQE